MGQNRPKSAARTGLRPKNAGPNLPEAKKGQPDPGQKQPARTRPGPEKKWPDPALLLFSRNVSVRTLIPTHPQLEILE